MCIRDRIYTGPAGIYSYDDMSAKRGISYYYYIQSTTDGSNNNLGILNPIGTLKSGRFYTRTSKPAYLRRQSGDRLNSIRVVPNPYHIAAQNMQYTGEKDKIMFLNIPGQCDIRVYTERGDLVHKIEHDDGSGDESWNLITSARQVIAPGIYLVHIIVTEDLRSQTGDIIMKKGDSTIKKFAVIR